MGHVHGCEKPWIEITPRQGVESQNRSLFRRTLVWVNFTLQLCAAHAKFNFSFLIRLIVEFEDYKCLRWTHTATTLDGKGVNVLSQLLPIVCVNWHFNRTRSRISTDMSSIEFVQNNVNKFVMNCEWNLPTFYTNKTERITFFQSIISIHFWILIKTFVFLF